MPDPAVRPKLTRPGEVREWIAAQNFLPSKALGQNFLIDGNILKFILQSAELQPSDRVLEIGPGLGILTGPLLDRTEAVVAIEKDKRLAGHLHDLFSSPERLILINSDALDVDLPETIALHRLNKLIANLPYSVASRLLVECFLLPHGFDLLSVTVQLEVGERLAAAVNTPDYGLLAIWAQLDYEVKIAKRISPTCFHPRPRVTSALVVMRRKQPRRAALKNPQLFDALIKTAFSHRRKQLGGILQSAQLAGRRKPANDVLLETGIDPKRRPETLAVAEWVALADALSE